MSVLVPVKDLKLAFLPASGRMGYALARRHAKAGFRVTLASRSTERAKQAAERLQQELLNSPSNLERRAAETIQHGSLHEAAAGADVVFWVAGPTGSLCKTPNDLESRFELLRSLRAELRDKLIVDCTNVAYAYDDSHWGQVSSLLMCQEALSAPANWTCAWKHVFFKRVLGDPEPDPANPMSVFVCGDNSTAKRTVIDIIDTLSGFKGLDAGSANHSRILELLGPKWLQELEIWNFDHKYQSGWRYGL